MSKKEKANEIICNQLIRPYQSVYGISKEGIKPEHRLVEDFRADSLDLAELVMVVEEAFGLEINNAHFREWETVDDIYKCVGV